MASSKDTSVNHRVLLIRNANSFDFGGAERFVVHLAAELNHNDWEATVISRHEGIEQYALREHVPFIRGPWLAHQSWNGWRMILYPLYVIWQLRLIAWYSRIFREYQPSVVHPQSRDDFIAATIAGRIAGARIVWTDHADLKYIYQNVGVWYKNPVGKWVNRKSRQANTITLVSSSEKQLIAKSLGGPLPDNYRVIYNGTIDTDIQPIVRDDSDKDALVFCATSRMVTAKGIGELINAFQRLEQENKKIRLWLVGDGPEIRNFQTLAEGDKHIRFFGFTNEVLETLASADVFVHPSYHEGFSISIVEAAMLRKPIIACEVGGNGEIVKDHRTGLLVAPKDAAALFDAMKLLAGDKALRDKLGSAARQEYQENFQFDTIVKNEFIPLYGQEK
jgi:glycosyltransferase involved in cell wall biosynthesis